ncbi:unnamed protein product [Euphydryas editha]|uniref:Uncharacterized protein n=1 Tax=Euphydryas editha TaxID=104508 RepID=A0AAU9V8X1_EUPED|nr:unnamed protein product [Euphydryas editha]
MSFLNFGSPNARVVQQTPLLYADIGIIVSLTRRGVVESDTGHLGQSIDERRCTREGWVRADEPAIAAGLRHVAGINQSMRQRERGTFMRRTADGRARKHESAAAPARCAARPHTLRSARLEIESYGSTQCIG